MRKWQGMNWLRKSTRLAIYKRDNFSCVYCGSNTQLEVDHLTPVKDDGKNETENLVTCCKVCNCRKGDSHWVKFTAIVALETNKDVFSLIEAVDNQRRIKLNRRWAREELKKHSSWTDAVETNK